MSQSVARAGKKRISQSDLIENIKLYLLASPVLIHIFIFCYIPMYGVLIAFQDYHPGDKLCSLTQSHWVGLKHFINFVTDPYFSRLIGNTVWLNILCLVFGFAAPIIFALLLNEITCSWYKKFVQTASYMPHFISSVIVVGMVFTFVNGEGIVNDFLALFGVQRSSLLVEPKAFPAIFVTTSVWKSFGWGSILYLSTISSIDPGLYESAKIDGANRLQRCWYVTLPHLSNLIIIQLIFSIGGLLGSNTELILLLYVPATYSTADVIGTYVYRDGLMGGRFSYGTAVGIFTSVINFTLLYITNKISSKVADYGIW